MPMNCEVIFGPPGTGKTTYLLQRMEEALQSGVDPQRIAFVSFTKSAASEAADRAIRKFSLSRKQLRWFRTLHSMAFGVLGVTRNAMLTDYREFGEEVGLRFAQRIGEDALRGSAGDQLLMARSLCAATGIPYPTIQRQYGIQLSPDRFERYNRYLEAYKQKRGLLEYHDLLQRFDQPLDVDVAFVDEAQDLTPAQWGVVDVAFRNVRKLYVAGDDDQAIYQWAGADVQRLLDLPGKQIVLNHSHRLPDNFQQYASKISERITNRKDKQWHGTGQTGELHRNCAWRSLTFAPGESWMVLARVNYLLPDLEQHLLRQGIIYTRNGVPSVKQEHARLYDDLSLLRGGATLRGTRVTRLLEDSVCSVAPRFRAAEEVSINHRELRDVQWLARWPQQRIRYFHRIEANYGNVAAPATVELTTIHQAKGKEADNVVLCPDLSAATWNAMGDPEHRTFYVGLTRAKKRLFLLRNAAEHHYNLP